MEEAKKEVDTTTAQENASTEEIKETTPKVEEKTKAKEVVVEKVEISKEELEKLQKKADDFDGIILKKRLEKLSGKDRQPKVAEDNPEPVIQDVDYITEIAREEARKAASELMTGVNKETFDKNLETAYHVFIRENKWADDDQIISTISKQFNPGTAVTVEDLVKKLDATAISTFPDVYKKHIEEKTKATIYAQSSAIAVGAAGSGVAEGSAPSDTPVEITDEDRRLAEKFFNGDMDRYLKYRQK